jgi:hypothetical protein
MTDRPEGKPIEHSGRIIRAEIRTKATPQEAYDAWADPEKTAHWFLDRAEGKAEPGPTITWIFDKFNYRIPYQVLIARPAVRELNDAVLWLTIQDSPGQIEVQAWLPACSLDPSTVEAFGKKWQQRLQGIFQN